MNEYTPKDHEIRSAAVEYRTPIVQRRELGVTIMQAERIAAAEFDRWLAEIRREAAAEALEKAADSEIPRRALAPYTRTWLRKCAAAYKKAEVRDD